MKIYHPEKSVILTKKIGKGSKIHAQVWIGKNVKVGKNVRIQAFVFIPDGVELEDNVFVGPGAIFTNDPDLRCEGSEFWKETLVKKGAKIGAGAIIRAGVVIGENAIIGMGSVVLNDVLAGTKVIGNPAREI